MADRIHDAFDSVKSDPRLRESTKQFLSKERAKRTRQSHHPIFRRALAAACLMLALAAGVGGYSWVQAPVSYVGIDVNPSIELALNRLDHVVDAKGYNEEGEEILRGLSLKGKSYTQAIDAVIGSDEMETYLTKEAEIVFTVAADGGRESSLQSGIESCVGHSGHRCQSVSMDVADVSNAHSYGISLGKYHAWMKLQEYEEDVTIDDCKDMSMSEIHDMIHEHEAGGHDHGSEKEHDTDYGTDSGDTDSDAGCDMDTDTDYGADRDMEEDTGMRDTGYSQEYGHGHGHGENHHRE